VHLLLTTVHILDLDKFKPILMLTGPVKDQPPDV